MKVKLAIMFTIVTIQTNILTCNSSLLNLIILPILPPSDEGGVSEADGGREK